MMPWNSWNIYRLLVLFIYFSLPSFLVVLGRQVALIPLKTRRMSHSPGTPSNGPPNNVQTREGTIRGNWCFHNRHLGAPQDQWVWSKEEWGERQGGESWRRSEWAKNAVGACSRWLGVGSCQKVLQHHHAIRNRGHVAQTTLPHHPPSLLKTFRLSAPNVCACLNVLLPAAPEGEKCTFQTPFRVFTGCGFCSWLKVIAVCTKQVFLQPSGLVCGCCRWRD